MIIHVVSFDLYFEALIGGTSKKEARQKFQKLSPQTLHQHIFPKKNNNSEFLNFAKPPLRYFRSKQTQDGGWHASGMARIQKCRQLTQHLFVQHDLIQSK